MAPLAYRPSSATVDTLTVLHSGRDRQAAAASPQAAATAKHATKLDLKLLLIDHYDSFTYNLVDMLGQHCVHPPLVVAADTSPEEIQRIFHDESGVDGIVLSPGPGNPDTCGPLAASVVQAHPDTPVLGVCLGHQILGTLHGATCTVAPTPVHGQVQALRFLSTAVDEDALWQRAFDLVDTSPSSWQVTRYHSLHVTDLDQSPLIPTSVTVKNDEDDDDAVVMSFRHPTLPHYGVQFHPESVGSNHGWALLRAFCDVCQQHKLDDLQSNIVVTKPQTPLLNGQILRHAKIKNGAEQLLSSTTMRINGVEESGVHQESSLDTGTNYIKKDQNPRLNGSNSNGAKQPLPKKLNGAATAKTHVLVYKVPHSHNNQNIEPWHVMKDVIGDDCHYRYWLDTSDKRPNAISVLGTADQRVEYWGQEVPLDRRGVYVYDDDNDSAGVDPQRYAYLDIITYLDNQQHQLANSMTWLEVDATEGSLTAAKTCDDGGEVLPFSYRGGYVGFLGYEVRHDTSEYLTKLEGGQPRPREESPSASATSTPTAAFMRADKSFVYHHDEKQWYLIGNVRSNYPSNKQDVIQWMTEQARTMQNYQPPPQVVNGSRHVEQKKQKRSKSVTFTPNRTKDTYNDNFESCLGQIRRGESYELCLTNQLETSVKRRTTPLDLYRILRRRNPAPFSAFFDWNSAHQIPTGSSFAICCSSPERFVSIMPQKDGTMRVEAKPIKGTCARVLPRHGRAHLSPAEEREDIQRAEDLRVSVKNRAENLMIVDLLRNDLSRVCRTGSVHVAKLMDIESFATVHQMVSTIRGTLDAPRQSAVSTLRACFPGGSMTGAPKLRTMQILDELEEGVPRGPYSGCLGYVGVNGAMDMNIIIRTAVVTPLPQVGSWHVSVGAGGAITMLSESEDEYEEMILKARAVVVAVDEWAEEHDFVLDEGSGRVTSYRVQSNSNNV